MPDIGSRVCIEHIKSSAVSCYPQITAIVLDKKVDFDRPIVGLNIRRNIIVVSAAARIFVEKSQSLRKRSQPNFALIHFDNGRYGIGNRPGQIGKCVMNGFFCVVFKLIQAIVICTNP
jgi:hypothetical protein